MEQETFLALLNEIPKNKLEDLYDFVAGTWDKRKGKKYPFTRAYLTPPPGGTDTYDNDGDPNDDGGFSASNPEDPRHP
jgi:hypothetical protein